MTRYDARQGNLDLFAPLPLFAAAEPARPAPLPIPSPSAPPADSPRFCAAPRIGKAQWLEEPESCERIDEINAAGRRRGRAEVLPLDGPAASLLDQATVAMNITLEQRAPLLALASVIAGLAGQSRMGRIHVAEALAYFPDFDGPDEPPEPEPEPPAPLAAEREAGPSVSVEESFFFGAVEDSYSADTIGMKGTTRKPFRHGGQLWVNTGGMFSGTRAYAKCYRLVPDPDGTAPPYAQHDWQAARGCDLGGYHGMGVKSGGAAMQLVGPETTFLPGPKAQSALL